MSRYMNRPENALKRANGKLKLNAFYCEGENFLYSIWFKMDAAPKYRNHVDYSS